VPGQEKKLFWVLTRGGACGYSLHVFFGERINWEGVMKHIVFGLVVLGMSWVSAGAAELAEHVKRVEILRGVNYGDPELNDDDRHRFEFELTTDSTLTNPVAKVEVTCPAGGAFTLMPGDDSYGADGAIELLEKHVSASGTEVRWCFEVSDAEFADLTPYYATDSATSYTIDLGFEDGTMAQTTVSFGDGGQALPEISGIPALAGPDFSEALASSVVFTWQPVGESSANLIFLDLEKAGTSAEQEFSTDYMSQTQVGFDLSEGTWRIGFGYAHALESQNAEGVACRVGTFARSEYQAEVEESGDTDLDGMTDGWERQIIDANATDDISSLAEVKTDDDFDGDGRTNLQEFQAGSNPTVAVGDHVYGIGMFKGIGEENDGTEYTLEFELETDQTVQSLTFYPADDPALRLSMDPENLSPFELQVPGYTGLTFVATPSRATVGEQVQWSLSVDLKLAMYLDEVFPEGYYTVELVYSDGATDRTRLWFGAYADGSPAPEMLLQQPEQIPELTPSLADTGDATLISWDAWAEVLQADPAARVVLSLGQDGTQTEYSLNAAVTSQQVKLADGFWTCNLAFGVGYGLGGQVHNEDGIAIEVAKYAEQTRTFQIPLIVDTDNDLMPDAWEYQIIDADSTDSINTLDDVKPDDDFDGDGRKNLEEYLAGSIPTLADGIAAHLVRADLHVAKRFADPQTDLANYSVCLSVETDWSVDSVSIVSPKGFTVEMDWGDNGLDESGLVYIWTDNLGLGRQWHYEEYALVDWTETFGGGEYRLRVEYCGGGSDETEIAFTIDAASAPSLLFPEQRPVLISPQMGESVDAGGLVLQWEACTDEQAKLILLELEEIGGEQTLSLQLTNTTRTSAHFASDDFAFEEGKTYGVNLEFANEGEFVNPDGILCGVVLGMRSQSLFATSPAGMLRVLAGWNLCSVPVQIADTAAELAVTPEGQSLKQGALYAWSAGQGRYQSLTDDAALTPQQGFWLYAPAAGVSKAQTGTAVSGEIALAKGWNLVGPVAECAAPVDARMGGVIWTWNPADGQYAPVTSEDCLLPGHAYWIYAYAPVDAVNLGGTP
jgi:hypothetical protein